MVNEKDVSGNLHWRINVPDGTTNVLVPESGIVDPVWLELKGVLLGLRLKVWRFFMKAWNLGLAEPKKAIRALKVGLALSIVSLFYHMRSLYESVGGNAMWAVMTVVVVFESLWLSMQLVLHSIKAQIEQHEHFLLDHLVWVSTGLLISREKFEPIIIGISVFLLASEATFSRFIPSVKSRFDFGALIFILTFSLVSVSGYRVEELSELAYQILSTIGIGTSFCILISMLFYPTWAGDELHRLIYRNLEKLADSLDGHVLEYFKDNEAVTEYNSPTKKIKGYKCVLESKATEDNWAKLARWEPAHGSFNFKHPWKQYLKIGASMRSCAYCIEALSSCMESETQTPAGIGQLKKHLSNACKTTNNYTSGILRELAKTIKTMKKSSDISSLVWEMNNAVQELQNSLKSVPIGLIAQTPEANDDGKGEAFITPVVEVLPVTTLVSLLIENAARINVIVDAVKELAGQVDMKPAPKENSKQHRPSSDAPSLA